MRYEIAPAPDRRFHIFVLRVRMPRRSDCSVRNHKAAEFAVFIAFGRVRPTRDIARVIFKKPPIIFFYGRRDKRRTLRAALFFRKIRSFEVRAENIAFRFSAFLCRGDVFHRLAHRFERARGNGGQNSRSAVFQVKFACV